MDNLHTSLPPRYGNCGQITLLLNALAQELQRLELYTRTITDRGLIATSDEIGLARWETDLGLPHRTDLDLHSRRVLLQGTLDRACNSTAAGLRDYAARLTGGAVEVEFQPNTFTFMLNAQANRWLDRYSVQHLLQERLPLHIYAQWQLSDTELVENS